MAPSVADVCVIIPAFNAESTIRRAIRSALAEAECAEVVVIDDGSTDRTAEAAHAVDDGSGRLQVRALPVSRGPAAARNLALSVSKAPWICPLDADDYFLPGRLARLRAQAEDCDLVGDDLLRATERLPDGPFRALVGERMALPVFLSFGDFVRANISRPHMPRAEWGFLKPLMQRAFLERAGLAYDERLRLGEDFILYATALAKGARFKVVEACGYVSVERADSLSSRHGAADLRNLLVASRALSALPLARKDAAAVRAHRRHVAGKVKLREFLETKRARGVVAAAALLARSPLSAPYVLSRAISDALRAAGSPAPPGPRPPPELRVVTTTPGAALPDTAAAPATAGLPGPVREDPIAAKG